MIDMKERTREIAELTDLLHAARSGRGGVALVCGPVAVGKSALLDAFAGLAADTGTLTLTATASEAESGLSLGVLAQLVLGARVEDDERRFLDALITRGAEELDAMRADKPAPEGSHAAAPPGHGYGYRMDRVRLSAACARIADRFCQRLVAISERTPLVLVVDDANHADTASLACLEYLIRRIRRTRIALVLGHGDDLGPSDTTFRLTVSRQPHSRVIDLAPLTRDGVAALLRDRLGADLGLGLDAGGVDRVVTECFEAGGGNPLLTHGLLADQCEAVRLGACELESAAGYAAGHGMGYSAGHGDASATGHGVVPAAEDGASGSEPATSHAAARAAGHPAGPAARVGDGFAHAVRSCLRRASLVVLKAAHGIAVLDGSPGLKCLLGLEPAVAAAAVRSLERAGLVARGRFRHAAAREAVLAGLGHEERTRLHTKAADIAYAAGRPNAEIAGHLLAAGRPTPWAVPVLEEAARTALADGRAAAAIDCLILARQACDDRDVRLRLTALLVRAEWVLSPAVPSQYLDELLEALEGGALAVSDATMLTRVLLWHGRTEDTLRIFKRWAAGDLKADADAEAAADLRITRAWLRSSFAPLLEHLPEPASVPCPGPTLGATDLRHRLGASTALDRVLTDGPSHDVVAEAERVLRRSGTAGVGVDAVESALLALVYGEQSSRAAAWCDKFLDLAGRRESPNHRARLSAIRAEISVRQGDLPAAERFARDGLDLIPAADWGVALGACLASLLTALTEMGRHEDAAELLSRPVPAAMLESSYGLHYLRARGRYFLATDDPGSAIADFLACGDLMRTWQIDAPGLLPWRADAAEALLATGAVDQARELLERELELCDRKTHPRAHGDALRILAATHELHLRPMLLRTAAEALKEGEDDYLLARALCDLTTAYRQLGESRRAQAIARQAWSIAQACRAEAVTDRLAIDAAPAEPEPPKQSAVTLSDAERRVADLVVHGLTNREIAQRLYITISTVEQHLTHTYRKLGVANRAGLVHVGLAGLGAGNSGVPALA